MGLIRLASVYRSTSKMENHSDVTLESCVTKRVWLYRAEGGANIVVALPDDGTILRFPKVSYSDPVLRLHQLAEYRNGIIEPLLGQARSGSCSVVRLSADDRLRLVEAIEQLRPEQRRGCTINEGGFALKMDDCAAMPRPLNPHRSTGVVISVEIKAKQGFLGADDDLGVCSFCMKQYLKLARGAVESISRYCPLDLFAGEFSRASRAVHALLDNPQNNMRVFVDGEYLYGSRDCDRGALLRVLAEAAGETNAEGGKLFDAFAHLLYSALSYPVSTAAGNKVDPDAKDLESGSLILRSSATCVEGNGPSAESFLGRVLQAQKFSAPGPTGTALLYESVQADPQRQRRLEEVYSAPFSDPCWTRLVGAGQVDGDDDPSAEDRRESDVKRLQRYSIGATMRDCSLMVTMQRAVDGIVHQHDDDVQGHVVADLFGKRWLTICRMMDLDPKHIERVVKQRQKKQRSRQLFQRASCQSGEAVLGADQLQNVDIDLV